MNSPHLPRAPSTILTPHVIFLLLSANLLVNIHQNVIYTQSLNSSSVWPTTGLEANDAEFNALINLTESSVVPDVTTISPEDLTSHTETVTLEPVTLESITEQPSHNGFDVAPCDSDDHCPAHSVCVKSFCKCIPDYCANNTTCLVTSGSEVTCLCHIGFSGKQCEFKDELCGKLVCQNGGICDAQSNHTKCHCPASKFVPRPICAQLAIAN